MRDASSPPSLGAGSAAFFAACFAAFLGIVNPYFSNKINALMRDIGLLICKDAVFSAASFAAYLAGSHRRCQ